MPAPKKVAFLSKEYPPYVYGGAGVHVEYLARALAKTVDVEMRCFGDQASTDGRLTVKGYPQWEETARGTDPRFVGAVDAFRALPRHGQGQARRRPRPLPHLVHRHGRRHRRQAVGHPQRPDHPFAGAAAPLEGRAARQRLPPVGLDGADRHRIRGRHRGGVARNQGGRAAPLRRRSRARPRHPQRHRPRRIPRRGRDGRADALRHRPQPALPALRRPHHAAEGHHPPSSTRSPRSTRRCRSCSAPARPTRPRSGARWRKASRRPPPCGPA